MEEKVDTVGDLVFEALVRDRSRYATECPCMHVWIGLMLELNV